MSHPTEDDDRRGSGSDPWSPPEAGSEGSAPSFDKAGAPTSNPSPGDDGPRDPGRPGAGQYASGQYGPGPYGMNQHGTDQYGTGPYGGVPTAVLQPVRALGGAAVAVAAVATGLDLLTGLTGLGSNSTAGLLASGGFAALGLLAWIAAFVVTCLWLWRVRANADVLSPGYPHKRSPGWVWGGWLVPVVNFWFPFQVVRDAVTASATASPQRFSRPPFTAWWATWLVGQLLTSLSGTVDGDLVAAVSGINAVGALVLFVSLVFWIRIVRAANTLQAAAER